MNKTLPYFKINKIYRMKLAKISLFNKNENLF